MRWSRLIGFAACIYVKVVWPGVDNSTAAPTVIWVHGGAGVAGDAQFTFNFLEDVSRAMHMRILTVQYRLAPETPLYGGVQDVVSTARWVHNTLGVETVIVAGESGGGLVALLALQSIGNSLPITAGLIISPMVDGRGDPEMYPSITTTYDRIVSCTLGEAMVRANSPLHSFFLSLFFVYLFPRN